MGHCLTCCDAFQLCSALYSRDNYPHAPEDVLSQEKVLKIAQNLTDHLKFEFPSTPVYPLLGNHDFYPRDQLPGNSNEQYTKLAEMWEDWITSSGEHPEALETFKKGIYLE